MDDADVTSADPTDDADFEAEDTALDGPRAESVEVAVPPAAGPVAEPVVEQVKGLSVAELDAVAAELADIETALARLDNGTYRTCEVTGEELPEALITANPVVRRLPVS